MTRVLDGGLVFFFFVNAIYVLSLADDGLPLFTLPPSALMYVCEHRPSTTNAVKLCSPLTLASCCVSSRTHVLSADIVCSSSTVRCALPLML